MIIVRKCYQKSLDIGVKLEENMYGRVFFLFPVRTPRYFLCQVPPPLVSSFISPEL